MADVDSPAPERTTGDGALPPAQTSRAFAWIWVGLALALIAKLLSLYRPDTPGRWIVRLLVLPFGILGYWAYRQDSGAATILRVLRAALFALLVVQAFFWGAGCGGIAAGLGAILIFTRFIRPRTADP